jgi:hypothetical protein
MSSVCGPEETACAIGDSGSALYCSQAVRQMLESQVTKRWCRLDDHEITVSHHHIVGSAPRCDGPTMAAEHDR